MTFTINDNYVIKMAYSDEKISAVLAESEQRRKRLRKLGEVMETVAAYRLKELQHFQAMEKWTTWRRTYGYDRDDSWMHGTRPSAPEEFSPCLWEEVNALKETTSISTRDRSRQRAKRFIKELKQGTVSMNFTDAELAMFKRFVEERDRDTAQVTAAPADTAQYRSPRSLTFEIPSDVCVGMEKKHEGRMIPEPAELELPSAGTGRKTPGQQCPPNGETGRTTADGCLLVSVGSNSGGNTFPPAEIAGGTRPNNKSTTPPTASNTIFLKANRKPEDKKKDSEANKQFDPGRKREKPPPWNVAVMALLFFFLGGTLGHGMPVVCALCFLYVCLVSYYKVITFQRAEKHERRRGSSH